MSDDPFAAHRLEGKVVVVTGGTQGFGAAGIVTCGRDATRGEAVRAELESCWSAA